MKEDERGPSLLYDYNSLNAWLDHILDIKQAQFFICLSLRLFHPVKQVSENPMSSVRPQGGNSDQNNSTNNAGPHLNGGVKVTTRFISIMSVLNLQHNQSDPDAMEMSEYEDDPTGVNPRKRKEPDSRVEYFFMTRNRCVIHSFFVGR